MTEEPLKRVVYTADGLPGKWPTNVNSASFWEELGRTVATFGLLEEVLARAIFAFTGTREVDPADAEEAFEAWIIKIERALSDQLGNLIDTYAKAVKEHPDATISNLDDLVNELREASVIRNVICHGSWRTPDASGASLPFFVNRKKEVWDVPMDEAYLNQVRQAVVGMIAAVMSTVTHMGWQFPGSDGPGKVIMEPRK